MSYFFSETENHEYVVTSKNTKAFQVEGSPTSFVRLAGQFMNRKLEPMIVTLAPKHKELEPLSHPGEEFYYVLKGTVLFRIENREYILTEGDAIHFPSEKPHQWENPLTEESTLLCILTPVIF